MWLTARYCAPLVYLHFLLHFVHIFRQPNMICYIVSVVVIIFHRIHTLSLLLLCCFAALMSSCYDDILDAR